MTQENFSLQAHQPLSSLGARFDDRMLATGTDSGAVLVFDLRHMQQAIAMYNFSEGTPVTEVRWQHAPHVSSRAKASAGAAAAAGRPVRAESLASQGSALGVDTLGLGSLPRSGSAAGGGQELATAGYTGLERHAADLTPEGSRGSDLDMVSWVGQQWQGRAWMASALHGVMQSDIVICCYMLDLWPTTHLIMPKE